MKNFLISSLVLLLLFTSCLFAGTPDKELHQKCLYPTIYVGRADQMSYGSGVIVRSEKIEDHKYKNVFITCAHLESSNYFDYEVKQVIYENWSEIKSTKTFPAFFYAANKELDLAVGVFYSEDEMPVAPMDFEPKLFIGNEVFRIGCGLGDEPRLDFGKVTQFKKNILKQFIRTSVHTVPGDSGSPLFHEYKVVGIMVSIRSHRNNPVFGISYAIPIERFKAWSKDSNNFLDFIWSNKEMPKLPFYYLNLREYEVKK
jgi:S1-C subfamily serine protease